MFLVSSLARQAARAASGRTAPRARDRQPRHARDFTDVHDVVRAYRLLASPEVPPAAYNVSSGSSISTAEQVAMVASFLPDVEVVHVVDPRRVRAHEVMELGGSSELLRAGTGWRPQIPIRQTIADTISWWESELTGPGGDRVDAPPAGDAGASGAA